MRKLQTTVWSKHLCLPARRSTNTPPPPMGKSFKCLKLACTKYTNWFHFRQFCFRFCTFFNKRLIMWGLLKNQVCEQKTKAKNKKMNKKENWLLNYDICSHFHIPNLKFQSCSKTTLINIIFVDSHPFMLFLYHAKRWLQYYVPQASKFSRV